MIYTVGHKDSYEQYFREDSCPKKLGRDAHYCGGTVWLNRQEAEDYLIRTECHDYAVYGVLAIWETDTIKSDNGPWHDLLITSPLVRL